jgi:hypothetical protein
MIERESLFRLPYQRCKHNIFFLKQKAFIKKNKKKGGPRDPPFKAKK